MRGRGGGYPGQLGTGGKGARGGRGQRRGRGVGGAFDAAAYDAQRQQADAAARAAMAHQEAATESGDYGAGLRNPWKWRIRKRIWDLLEEKNIARFPRPVHHRIPNFEGAEQAAERLSELREFQAAALVKVNPDTPQKPVRVRVLESGKTLMVPQPRLRTGFFSLLTPEQVSPSCRASYLATSAGVAEHGRPLGLHDRLEVGLVVVGSVAVCPETGARIGKGEGFAELEYGMLRWMEAVSERTLVATTVHDEQLVSDIPSDELLEHDVRVDVICTPTRVIRVPRQRPQPTGIYWELLSPEKLAQVAVLRQLKRHIERETGRPLPSGPSEQLPPSAARGPPPQSRRGRGGGYGRGR
eukprot:TRINITY_DN47483_c0_g1_i1.p1 TRINITY_DN47483_c0_g1~~TRINITY_DN47483_c0_g1_i1.p1  ORF type:complete len:376 (+),score=127.58 TRINITY_DN47483_c0_g1_i1:64-1128(+)